MRLINYYYYTNKEKANGKNRLSNRVEKSFHFDTKKFIDDKDNYKNVISEYMTDIGIEHYGLTITKWSNSL